MNPKLAQLAERRSRLVAQAAAQRTALAHNVAPWRARLALVDQGVALFRAIGRHPVLMVGGRAAACGPASPPRGKWLQRGWLVWRIGRRLR